MVVGQGPRTSLSGEEWSLSGLTGASCGENVDSDLLGLLRGAKMDCSFCISRNAETTENHFGKKRPLLLRRGLGAVCFAFRWSGRGARTFQSHTWFRGAVSVCNLHQMAHKFSLFLETRKQREGTFDKTHLLRCDNTSGAEGRGTACLLCSGASGADAYFCHFRSLEITG